MGEMHWHSVPGDINPSDTTAAQLIPKEVERFTLEKDCLYVENAFFPQCLPSHQ